MVLQNTTLELEFAKIHKKGAKYTLNFIKKIMLQCPVDIRKKIEEMIYEDTTNNMKTTDEYKQTLKEFENIYKPGSIKTLKYIEKHMKSLPEHALKELFNIVKKNNEDYTVKKSEILLNLGSLKESTIQELLKSIIFINNSIKNLNNIAKEIQEIKKANFSNTDITENMHITEDPNYKPILHDYTTGPAPVLEKHHA